MKVFFPTKLLLLFFGVSVFWPPPNGSATEQHKSYIAAGLGIEQLSYTEQTPDLELVSSDTAVNSWVLSFEGRKSLQNVFMAARGSIPIYTDETLEYWTRAGDHVQTNTLTYHWARIDVHAGYFLHRMLTPYAGIQRQYSEQQRSGFENIRTPDTIDRTATEEVSA